MHLASPSNGLLATSAVVGTTIPLALGSALAARRRRSGARVVVFFGDGALDEGVFWESLNFACLQRLSVLFVCEDNGLAIHSRSEWRHGYDSAADVVERFRCRVIRSETSDALELCELAESALRSLDAGEGPVFLYVRCYRFVEHVGVTEDQNFHLPYRERAEFERWKAQDPLVVLGARLLGCGVSEAQLRDIESEVDAQVRTSVERARRAPFPPPEALHSDVFA